MVNAIPVPVLSDNYVWVVSKRQSSDVLIIDPGEHQKVGGFLDEFDFKCSAVLLTHHHSDHIGGAAMLGQRWNCPIFGPVGESIPCVTNPVDDGDEVTVGGLSFRVLEVPGHTRGHVAYFGNGLVLSGDTLFAGGCGRVFEGTPAQMFESVSRLGRLDPATLVCCAHEYTVANLRFAVNVEPGNTLLAKRFASAQTARSEGRPTLPSQISEELATNPFLRCHQPEVVDSASKHADRTLKPGPEVFAEVRRWKDHFR